jgi:hypothetical protein
MGLGKFVHPLIEMFSQLDYSAPASATSIGLAGVALCLRKSRVSESAMISCGVQPASANKRPSVFRKPRGLQSSGSPAALMVSRMKRLNPLRGP